LNTLHTLRRAVLASALVLAVAAMAFVALMMLTITYDVLVRTVLSEPTDWAYPLNSAAVLAATSLAVPYFYARGQHISMDLLHRALRPGARRAADLVTTVATAFLGVVLAVTAFRSMRTAIEGGLTGSGTFSIPLWMPDAVLCVSGAMLALVAVLFPPGVYGSDATAARDKAADDAPEAAASGDTAEGEARS
jgi:TRAP-type C4-dicarboxylate transport system permease small subunit